MTKNNIAGILLIGGPSTGKSTTLFALEQKGFKCLPEIAREVTIEAQKKGIDQLFVSQPLLFSEMLLEGRIKQHQEALENLPKISFIDRGIPDVLAYLRFSKSEIPSLFEEACQTYKYQKVFHFPIWDEIYVQDGERYESLEQAKIIDAYLISTYKDFGYEIIEVPKDSIENRCNFIIEQTQI